MGPLELHGVAENMVLACHFSWSECTAAASTLLAGQGSPLLLSKCNQLCLHVVLEPGGLLVTNAL